MAADHDNDVICTNDFSSFILIWFLHSRFLGLTFLLNTLQKNTYGALMVLRKMELADVKPDSQTFSYLISNCDCEEDIIKVV